MRHGNRCTVEGNFFLGNGKKQTGGVRIPAIGTAEGIFAEIKEDIDGQPRGGTVDVGCDQVSAAPVLRRPLKPADVGPRWLPAVE